jgi:O-antigen/teichoic acid export membrane protein
MRRLFLKIVNAPFLRSSAILTLGTIGAQLVALAAMPALTRIYSPSEFGDFAAYLSIVTIFSLIACARFELAIPLASDDAEADSLLAIALAVPVLIGALLTYPTLALSEPIAGLLNRPHIAGYLIFVPMSVVFGGWFLAFQFWGIREALFGGLAKNRVLQSAVGTGVQVAMRVGGPSPNGLIVGHNVFQAVGALGLAALWFRTKSSDAGVLRFRMSKIAATFRRNWRFPAFSVPEALANGAALEVPVLLVAALAAGPEAGFLLLAIRIVAAPLQVVGSAIGQVFISRAASELRAGRLRAFTLKLIAGLAMIGAPVLALVAALAAWVFGLVFGPNWVRAGEIVQLLSAAFFLQFVASPLSTVLHVTGRQGLAFAFQLFVAVLRIGSICFAHFVLEGFHIEALALSAVVHYGLYLALVIYAAVTPHLNSEAASAKSGITTNR